MIQLTREVRFSIRPPVDARTGQSTYPSKNSWAGWPAASSVAPYVILRCTVGGDLEPESDYVCNIKLIDDLVRQEIVDSICQNAAAYSSYMSILNLAKEKISAHLPTHLSFGRLEIKTTPYVTYAWVKEPQEMISVTEQFEFSASHRLHNPELSDQENLALFGKCNHVNGHGHNYCVDVTVENSSDQDIDLSTLEEIVGRLVIDRLDHRYLNLDIEEFKTKNPTVENIAKVIFQWLDGQLGDLRLQKIRVYETPKTWAEIEASI